MLGKTDKNSLDRANPEKSGRFYPVCNAFVLQMQYTGLKRLENRDDS